MVTRGAVMPRHCDAIAAPEASPPAAGRRLAASPNPFNPRTTIRFALDRAGPATLTVHDLAGRRLRTLRHGVLAAGEHHAIWDGRDAAGRALSSGVYLARLAAEGCGGAVKLVLIR